MSVTHLSFKNELTQSLFEEDYTINPSILKDILELGEEIVPDLLLILDDALQNTTFYTEALLDNEGGFAPRHAVYLLRDLKVGATFERLVSFLNKDTATLDRLLGAEFFIDEFWSFVCHYGHNHLEVLEKKLYSAELDIKMAISGGLAQMANYYPNKRKEVLAIFERMAKYYLEAENIEKLKEEEGIFENSDYDEDIEFISVMTCDMLDANLSSLASEVDELFEYDLIDGSILEPELAIFREHKLVPDTIFDLYEAMQADEDDEEASEDDEKPKVKRMKD